MKAFPMNGRWWAVVLSLSLVWSVAFGAKPRFNQAVATKDLILSNASIFWDTASREYYLYGSGPETNGGKNDRQVVECYRSTDLSTWLGPFTVLEFPRKYWADVRQPIRSPKVYAVNGSYYLLATFSNPAKKLARELGRPEPYVMGVAIWSSRTPGGPFKPLSEELTPDGWMCMDGALWYENGKPWLVYARNWEQATVGTIMAVSLTSDLSQAVGPSITLLRPSAAKWTSDAQKDGLPWAGYPGASPLPWKTNSGDLLLIWTGRSSMGPALAVARSLSGGIEGPWAHASSPLLADPGEIHSAVRGPTGTVVFNVSSPSGGAGVRLGEMVDNNRVLGLTVPPEPPPRSGYLFAHSTDRNYRELFYSVSRDGFSWRTLNQGKPILGNDYGSLPDICRGTGGRYYLLGDKLATGRPGIAVWASEDLVKWTKIREISPTMPATSGVPADFKNYGAPKIFYDQDSRTYYISWHSTSVDRLVNPDEHWRNQRTYYTKSDDLIAFTEPRRLFPDTEVPTIDAIIRKEDARYYVFYKQETPPTSQAPRGKAIKERWGPSPTGPWKDINGWLTPNSTEAPTVAAMPGGRGWYLYYEEYQNDRYMVQTAERLAGPWRVLPAADYATLRHYRHGCVIALDQTEWVAIDRAYDPEWKAGPAQVTMNLAELQEAQKN